MTIIYTLKNNTTAAVQLFKESTGDIILKNGSGAAVRLAVGEQITSTELKGDRYKVIKGLAGWVDKSKMSLMGQVDTGPVDPPPVDPPPVDPPPVVVDKNFTVTVNTYLGIYTVLIEGDETIQLINVILNGRPLV